EQRRRLHVRRDDLPVTVENVGARRCNRVLRDAAAPAVSLADRREHHQPERDDGKNADEDYDRQSEPRLCLDVTIDVTAVEHGTKRALPSAFRDFCPCVHPVTGLWPAAECCRSFQECSARAWPRSGRHLAWREADGGAAGRGSRTAWARSAADSDAGRPGPGCGLAHRVSPTPRAEPELRCAPLCARRGHSTRGE